MLLTITCTRPPATDLGYLLHKNPARVQTFSLAAGQAHVFYPEASDARCTAALLLELDPIGLVRGSGGEGGLLDQYVNDRPYIASSFLSVAIAEVFGSALAGRSRDRPVLVDVLLPLEARVAVVKCRDGESLLRRLFEPLGYAVEARGYPLDPAFPDWGDSPYYSVFLRANARLQDLLRHLYVLLPVLDGDKHYWVGDDEVDKLLRHGEGWLAAHPERALIARRYLKHRASLAREALARLLKDEAETGGFWAADSAAEDDDGPEAGVTGDPASEDVGEPVQRRSSPDAHASGVTATATQPTGDRGSDGSGEPKSEPAARLHDLRLDAVVAALKAAGATRVLDLGCGEGRLLKRLLADRSFTEILGMDVSHRSLEIARDRLRLDRLPDAQKSRMKLLHGSLMYRDRRLEGFDAAAIVEVVEHLDPPRLAAFDRVVFEHARPKVVVLTTPNRDYNIRYTTMPAGKLRHADHRFEWSRSEFQAWAERVAARFGYVVTIQPIGPLDPDVGAPSQLGVFTLAAKRQGGS